jgi:uncharacterized protein YecE (DUF72 family)
MKGCGALRIGISGWRYPGWRGKFYPKGLPHRRELEYASRILNSVEINGSFYSLQLPSSYQRWYSETPDGATDRKIRRDEAFVFADSARKFPYAEDLTADLVYIRLHGATKLYVSGYDDKALGWWANRIKLWRRSKPPRGAKTVTHAKTWTKHLDVFVYFDNDAKVHAPFDAQRLAARLGVK